MDRLPSTWRLAVVQQLQPRTVDVVLVGNLPDQFFEDVLQSDQACRAAVLVDNDGQVLLAGLHFPHHLGHALAFGQELGLAHEAR